MKPILTYGSFSLARGSGVLGIIGIVVALMLAVFAYIFIVPEKEKRNEPFKSNKFFCVLHDIFNFKQLLLEKILKFVYIFATFACILVGFFTLFTKGGFGSGLIMMILGPIVCRITFELIMLAVIAVKNIVDINKKLPPRQDAPETAAPDVPEEPEDPQL